MRYKYVEAYSIKGLVGPAEEELIIKDENFTAYLVSNPDQRLVEIDKRMAIANFMLNSVFTGRPDGKLEELIEGRILEIRKERSKNKNGYLIIEIWEELQEFKPSAELKSKIKILKAILIIMSSLVVLYLVFFLYELTTGTWKTNNTLGTW